MEHKYTLEPYKGLSSRYRCPYCNHKDRKFTRYIDTETGEHLADHVGKCERIESCGEHYKPRQYFKDNGLAFDATKPFKPAPIIKAPAPKSTSFIPSKIVEGSLRGYAQNHFVTFLTALFGSEAVSLLVSRYFIGTSKHWPGSTVFWQIDTKGRTRSGKIMLYNPNTGKRVKKPYNHLTWTHSALKLPEFNLRQCFFGEHLLKDNTKPVAIVESEKTAAIASLFFPQFIWLAVGSLTNLSQKRCAVLVGRHVTLFPDLNAYDKWKEKGKALTGLSSLTVSDLLERKATEEERQQGLDLADYLVRFNPSNFAPSEPEEKGPEKGEVCAKLVPVVPKFVPHEKFVPNLCHTHWHKKSQKNSLNEQETALVPVVPVVPNIMETEPIKKLVSALDLEQMGITEYNKTEVNNAAEIKEIAEYFKTVKLPSEPIMIDNCSKIIDIVSFVKHHLYTIHKYKHSRASLPYLDRLFKVKSILNSYVGGTSGTSGTTNPNTAPF